MICFGYGERVSLKKLLLRLCALHQMLWLDFFMFLCTRRLLKRCVPFWVFQDCKNTTNIFKASVLFTWVYISKDLTHSLTSIKISLLLFINFGRQNSCIGKRGGKNSVSSKCAKFDKFVGRGKVECCSSFQEFICWQFVWEICYGVAVKKNHRIF